LTPLLACRAEWASGLNGPWGSLGATRVLRGGSWNNNTQNLRAANRNNNAPDNRNNKIGFRVCRVSHIVITPQFSHPG
jgi:formylglycine-generating enzyme required for sulfatase activity